VRIFKKKKNNNTMKRLLIKCIILYSIPFLSNASANNFNILDYKAVGDNQTINTKYIQSAIDDAHNAGGGTVVVPAGRFLSGTLYLKDNINLHLEENAFLVGSPFLSDYPVNELTTTRSYTERYSKKALIYAEGAKNIKITGHGVIDGNSNSPEFENAERGRDKPLGIKLVSCVDVRVEDVTIMSAGLWLQHYLNCDSLLISGITAINHGHFTNDGLDIDGCRNVIVENVYIDSHDDALVFKSTGPNKCENIIVRNCILKSHCHGLKFGTETTGGFKNVDISNISISPSDSLHPKTHKPWRVITGIAMEITDGGKMENIRVSNLKADSVYAPIFIKLGNRARKHKEDAIEPAVGEIEGIWLSNFRITNAGKFSSSITGFPEHNVRNINLENIYIQCQEAPMQEEIFSEVPENEERYPEITMFTKGLDKTMYLPSYGLFVRHVDGLKIKNFHVLPADGETRSLFIFENATNIEK
jgi:polygalacturonase